MAPDVQRSRRNFSLNLVGSISKLVLLALSIMISSSQAQKKLSSGRVIVSPNFVGAQSADLELAFYSPLNVPSLSTISVTVPQEESSLSEGTNISCRLQGIFTVGSKCATDGPSKITFTLPSGFKIIEKSFNSLIFSGVFFSPLSTKPTQPFKVEIRDPSGAILMDDADDLVLDDLVAADIQGSFTSQINSVIVSKPTAVYVSLTTLNQIPITGGVQLRLPKWN